MKIALDAMGGDKAPEVVVVGARDALALYPKIKKLYLVGDAGTIEKECGKQGLTDSRLNIVHAPEVIGMHESAVKGLRRKKKSSISIATDLVKGGDAEAAFDRQQEAVHIVDTEDWPQLKPGALRRRQNPIDVIDRRR